MIMNVGRICRIVKGKDAGKYCAVVSKLGRRDKNFVLIEGVGVKRRKMNTLHLEPLPPVLEIEKSTEADAVVNALKEKGFVN